MKQWEKHIDTSSDSHDSLNVNEKNDVLNTTGESGNYKMKFMKESVEHLRSLIDTALLKGVGIVLSVIVIVLFGVGFAATQTIPGQMLHGLKVGFVEEMLRFTKLGAHSEGDFYLSLLEERLDELIKLRNRGELNTESFMVVEAEAEENTRWLNDLIGREEDAKLTKTEVLDLLSSASALAEAQETVLEDTELNAEEEEIEDLRRDLVNLFEDRVEQFVMKSDSETLQAYVDSQLNRISAEVERGDVSPEVTSKVEDRLDDIREAFVAKDNKKVIVTADEALRLIGVERHLAELDKADDGKVAVADSGETATQTATQTASTSREAE